jgi:hypothetical protein
MKAKLPQSRLVLLISLSFASLEVYFASFSLRFALFASAHLAHPNPKGSTKLECMYKTCIYKVKIIFFLIITFWRKIRKASNR